MTTIDTHSYWTATAKTVATYLETREHEHEHEEESVDEYSKHKFGLCEDCGCGLDDESDFVVHTYTGGETAFICFECRRFPCPWNPTHYR